MWLRLVSGAAACLAAAPACAQAQSWETFGDWRVAAVHDDMDPTSHVLVRTTFTPEPSETRATGSYEVGFRIFGGTLVAIDTMIDFPGRNYWPHCSFDSASYRVDGRAVRYLATIDRAGLCNGVSSSVIRDFMGGTAARVRLNGLDGAFSLRGFTAAWHRARQLGRPR